MSYIRVLPRDLFNEASLLKCYARLWILLDQHQQHIARFVTENVDTFRIEQDQASGAIYVENIVFTVGSAFMRLSRPLNARSDWPLYVEPIDNPDVDPIAVFDDAGNLSAEMIAAIAA